jgi:hypothetical protein
MIPISGFVRPDRGGTFTRLAEYEPGAVQVDFLYLREPETLDIYDCVAWEPSRPGKWRTEHGIATYEGDHELRRSWWEKRPALLVPTPADFIARHGAAFVILDWDADINDIIGRAPAVQCSTDWLKERLTRTLIAQARPKLRIYGPSREVRRAA